MRKVLTHSDYLNIRQKHHKKEFHLTFGGQFNAYMSDADITIIVGNRGSSKSTTILARSLGYVHEPNFNAYYLRKEVKDSTAGGGIIDASKKFFARFGTFRESLQHLDWSFPANSRISFINYSAPVDEFKEKVQGREVDKIFVDEIAQMSEEHFNIIMANLRNSKQNMRPQIFGTCNPDADSWIKQLISPYIDLNSEYHTHKPELNGRKMYFFQVGDSVNDAIYGFTKEEVYKHAKEYIDKLVANSGIKNVDPLDAILSICCYYIPKSENIHLTHSKGGGLALDARMQKMSLQQRIYAIYGGWKKVSSSANALVGQSDLDRWFENGCVLSGVKYASMDISGAGKDKTYLIIWDGYHITNIHTTQIKDAKSLFEWTTRILNYEGVPINSHNFVYDYGGLGWAFSGHFQDDEAMKFMSQGSSTEDSKVEGFDDKKIRVYRNAKSEVVGKFLDVLKNYNNTGECGISIESKLLNQTLYGKTVMQWIEGECRGLEWRDSTDGIKQLITTKDMNAKIGWHSDLLFSIIYRFALDVGDTKKYEQFEENDFFDLLSFAL